MNDLSGLDWTIKPGDNKNAPVSNASYSFAGLHPTALKSGKTTPVNTPLSNPTSKPATPANDSFANLVSFKSLNVTHNPSLQERQRQLAEEKRQQATTKNSPFNGVDEQIWEKLGSGRSTPTLSNGAFVASSTEEKSQKSVSEDGDDFLAVFDRPTSSSVPVKSKTGTPVALTGHANRSQGSQSQLDAFDDDDDPFGLTHLRASGPSTGNIARVQLENDDDDDDDVLGLLAKPANSIPKPVLRTVSIPKAPEHAHPQAQAVAELVDMGFPAEKAQQALETTDSGTDVQAAVGYLLNQAHAESKHKSKPRGEGIDDSPAASASLDRSRRKERYDSGPDPRSRRQESSSASQAEKAPTEIAAELSTKFLKTAGTFWKQSTKKLQQAVEDFNSDSDSSQPKWMREPERIASERRSQTQEDEAGVARRRRRSSAARQDTSVTNEAIMLERARPEPRPPIHNRFGASSADASRDQSPAVPSRLRESIPAKPASLRAQQAPAASPRQRLSTVALEEQASQAYISPARRRKAAIAPPATASEPDLLDTMAPSALPPRSASTRPPQSIKAAPPTVVRSVAPPRTIPPVSGIALKSSQSHRQAGNAHFKRGDYPAAHASYAMASSHLPKNHPLAMLLLTNSALTALKIGEPKQAITAADSAIALAGPTKGEGEVVDLGTGDAPKPMRGYYGKALMRKAEALEELERWGDAAAVWREAVEGGHGGPTSLQGRARAEKAANPPAQVRMRKPAAAPVRRMAPVSQKNSAAAVQALRAANAAAEKADDEKFALSDSIDARLAAWKGGKADNLRALLGSLDMVLWPEAGWTKISMADLVLPKKVKIQYMKGIAKVHPDKIPPIATVEQRMIAGAVFSTLNEAWDKFKSENGL